MSLIEELNRRNVIRVAMAYVVVAWLIARAFELTPEGVKRVKDVDRSASGAQQTGTKLDCTIIGVLPFVNMSSDPEQEYFSDGISEELLNVLSKIPGLRVSARTSSFQYRKAGIVGDGRSFGADYEEGLALYLSGEREQEARQIRERKRVLTVVCTDNRYEAVWQPVEGTCELFTAVN